MNYDTEMFRDLLAAMLHLSHTLRKHSMSPDVVLTLASGDDGAKLVCGVPSDFVKKPDNPDDWFTEAKILGVTIRWAP